MLLSPTRMRVEPPAAANSAEAGGRSQAIAALRHVLARDNAATRCSAVRSLARMNAGDPKTTQALTGLLRDPDPDVRVDAAAALGRMQAGHAVAALIENLESDPEGEVRSEVAKALGRIGSHSAVEALIHCLQRQGYPELDAFAGNGGYAPSWEVQTRSLEALGEIGDARAADAVIEALAAEDSEALQEGAFRVLARLGGARAGTYLLDELRTGARLARRRAARALAALPQLRGDGPEFPPELVQPLMDALLDADAGVRIEAARALAASGVPTAAVAITLLLNDRDAEVRKEVVKLFSGIRADTALDRLHAMLTDSDPELRKSVVRVLGDIGDTRSMPLLGATLCAEDETLRYEAIGALGRIGRACAEDRLMEILASPKAHHSVRTQAAWALGRMFAERNGATAPRDEPARAAHAERRCRVEEALTAAVRDRDERVSHAALCALVEIDPGGAAGRLGGLLEAPRAVAQDGRRPRGEPKAELPGELRDLVEGQSAQTSTLAAIFAAHADGHPAAAKADRAPAPSDALRILATRLLGNLARPGAAAVDALRRACAEADTALRREALLALGRIGDPQGFDALLAGLEDEAREVRLAALDALGGLREVPDLGVRVAALCDDPDAEVRVRAVNALAATQGPLAGERLRGALEDENRDVCRAALGALSRAAYTTESRDRVVDLLYRFSGELRIEAAAALRRLGDFDAAAPLLAALEDVGHDEYHGTVIDALGELFAAAKDSP